MNIKIPENSPSRAGLKELIRKTGEFLDSGSMNTVIYLSGLKLIAAMENEEYSRMLAAADLTVYEDIEVLKALNLASSARVKEIEEKKYLKEILKKLSKEQRKVFLLADTPEGLILLENELCRLQSNLRVSGMAAIENFPENKESMINNINFTAPDVILSNVSFPGDITLLNEYGNYLNASLWISLPMNLKEDKNMSWLDKINKIIWKKLLNKKINHSKDTEKSSL